MILLDIPSIIQSTNYSCGPACATVILKYYGYKAREKIMIKRLEADPDEGVSPENLVKYFRDRRFKIKQKHDMTIEDLEKLLDKGFPVIVAYQDWSYKPSETNYHKTWDNGHYAVVMGYDKNKIYLSDPSSKKKKKGLKKEDFYGRWRDISSDGKIYHRWGVSVGPRRKLIK